MYLGKNVNVQEKKSNIFYYVLSDILCNESNSEKKINNMLKN